MNNCFNNEYLLILPGDLFQCFHHLRYPFYLVTAIFTLCLTKIFWWIFRRVFPCWWLPGHGYKVYPLDFVVEKPMIWWHYTTIGFFYTVELLYCFIWLILFKKYFCVCIINSTWCASGYQPLTPSYLLKVTKFLVKISQF